jgi:hypothetical protein
MVEYLRKCAEEVRDFLTPENVPGALASLHGDPPPVELIAEGQGFQHHIGEIRSPEIDRLGYSPHASNAAEPLD